MGMKPTQARVASVPMKEAAAGSALEAQDPPRRPKRLAEILVEKGLVAPGALPEDGGDRSFRLDPSLFLETEILELIPRALAFKHCVLPLAQTETGLFLAAGAFPPKEALRELKQVSALEPHLLFVDKQDLTSAIELCYSRVRQLGFQQMRLGEILVARGLITREQLEQSLEKQEKTGQKLGEILVESGFATEDMIYSSLAEKLGFEFESFKLGEADAKAGKIISKRFAESHLVLPRRLDEASGELVVAMSNPEDLAVADLLRKLCQQRGYDLKLVVSTPSSIDQGIAYTYHSEGMDVGTQGIEMETVVEQGNNRSDLVLSSEMPRIKKIINHVLFQAVVEGASDIHIENLESRVRIRFRIDGILQLRDTPVTKDNIGQVISVLKIDSGLDITERRRPQDGVFKKRIGDGWYIDFRINVHSSQFGPDAVIRILDATKRLPKLDQLGLPDDVLERYLKLVHNPQGLILITGPTGSGKSTTLYSTLSYLNRAERKIVTAEDPVEYHVDGICQYQVHTEIGNTFAEYGRRFLRKDPDIILIGETRDETTAEACLRAAMTGHLVFSTLHTNNSTAALPRLIDLGVDASAICDALLAIVAQRLVRVNCPNCSEKYTPPAELLEEFFGDKPPRDAQFIRGIGCEACNHTGYRGRVGVFEFWQIDRATRGAILSGIDEPTLQKMAAESGLEPLVSDALSKAFAGTTTLEELRRVVPLEQIRMNAERR